MSIDDEKEKPVADPPSEQSDTDSDGKPDEKTERHGEEGAESIHIPIGLAIFQVDGYGETSSVLPANQVQRGRFGLITVAIDDAFNKNEQVALCYDPDVLDNGKGHQAPRQATIIPGTPFAFARFSVPPGAPTPKVTITATFNNNQVSNDLAIVVGQHGILDLSA